MTDRREHADSGDDPDHGDPDHDDPDHDDPDHGDDRGSPWADGSIPVPPPMTAYPWDRRAVDPERSTTRSRWVDGPPSAPTAPEHGGVVVEPASGSRRPVDSEPRRAPGRARSTIAALVGVAALAAGAVVVVTSGDEAGSPATDERGQGRADEPASGAGTRSADTASAGPAVANGEPTAGGTPADRRPQASSSIGMADDVPPPARWPLESGLSLVALAEDGSIVTIDVDAGDRQVRAGRAVDHTRPAYVVPDQDGVSVVGHDPSESFRLTRDGVLRATRRPLDGPLFPGPDPGTAWRLASTTGDATDADYELVDADGTALGPRLDLGVGDVLGGDGRGGLLVRTRDRIVVAAAVGGEELITNGVVVAAGPGAAWVRECTLQECRLVRVERSGGDRQTIDLDAGVGVPSRGLVGVSRAPIGPMGQTVSPDGDVALVRRSPASTEWLMVDLAAGRATVVPAPAPGAPVVWTDDSRYAVWLSAGTMRVFDRTAAGYVDVEGTPALRAFGELPASRQDPPSAGGYPRRIADFADPAHGVPAAASGPGRSGGSGVLRGARRLPAATIPPPLRARAATRQRDGRGDRW